ncbi:sugar ABC transporter ATP-binding protein [Mesorhizobium sp. CO1-1-8]|uniref:sugar ABC transporter ATP-binding protein n=1 Tax=Mesorhizobium sp. CO1-1-8 TaxID=2876631 RepID=UPI001CD1008C|nr:sugar ABC transporter ATP-binding protein [Mesorhizobium sp. CO1-1-8]MBZ9772358.1 sugar ABC transporter ATP-binding protein [Mesorhizobium sp. CO1-1-8]
MMSALSIKDLRKSYGSIEVLRGIDLDFFAGQVHAFLGANGAGKSTMLGCLSGAVRPSSGEIVIKGQHCKELTPRQSRQLGIGIIYQHFQVIEGLTVADNIFLGSELLRLGIVNSREQHKIAKSLLDRLGASMDPRSKLQELSVGQRQLVEIARALHLKPDILILDEPTSALSTREMKTLHQTVRQLAKEENLAIVYVTHLIDEVEMIADTVTVLRDGNVVWTRPVAQATHDDIARAIAPNMADRGARARFARGDDEILALNAYCTEFTGPIDLSLHAGEIVGVYGLLGSGRTDLLESLVGARRRVKGSVRLGGRPVGPKSPGNARALGLALVASDRAEQSLFLDLSALENLLMPHFGSYAGGRKRQDRLFKDAADRLQLRPKNPSLAASRFSGGNAQKLVMGRWLFPELGIRLLLLDEPTQGVDIGAREELYHLLRQFTLNGGTVLFASSDPEEVVALADRVLVLAQGRQVSLLDGEITEEKLVQSAYKSALSPALVSQN